MAMNEMLASYYGTAGAGQREELEKSAQVELFAKLASDNGIDLNALSDEQVQGLWEQTFKTAEFPPKEEGKKDDEDEDKKEKAKAEFAEKKEASDKLAEADFLGRTMAHAYVDELNKIGSTGFRAAGAQTIKERAGALVDKAKGHISSAKDKAMNRVGESVAGSVTGGAHKAMHPEEQKALREFGAKAALRGGAAVGAGATAAGGAAYAAHKKQGSALDQVAAELAVEKAAEAGFDANEAAQRVDALLTLGVGESEKVASASDFNEAVDVRSLELLEGAGYPVEWSKTAGADTFVSKAKSHLADAAKAKTLRSGLATRKALKDFGTGVDKSKLDKLRGENRKDIAKGLGKTVGLYGGGAAAVGGGAYAAHKKHGSAEEATLDDLALDLAVEKAAEAGFNAEEAAHRAVAVMTLGLEESAKVASAQDVEGAVEIRSLEILEAAGYPINWA